MKVEESKCNEKLITTEEIPKIDPNTIYKIILLDGTTLVVQNKASKFNDIVNDQSKDHNNIGGAINLKLNQIPNTSSKKPKGTFNYIEWDFPKANNRNNSYQRNLQNELKVSKTEQNENEQNEINIKEKDNARESKTNKNRKSKNYSFLESKHISQKGNKIIKVSENEEKVPEKEEKNNLEEEGNDENKNYNNINNIDNIKEEKEEEKRNDIFSLTLNPERGKEKQNTKEIKEINEERKEKINKDNLSFNEKIKLIKYGLMDYGGFDTNRLKNEENNIQQINKIKPLNIIIEKSKKINEEDINEQFNKLLNKFNENKSFNKKEGNEHSYYAYKSFPKENTFNNDINKYNNYMYSKKSNLFDKKSSYKGLNERITQLKKKTNNNLINFFPTKTINGNTIKFCVLPSNFK